MRHGRPQGGARVGYRTPPPSWNNKIKLSLCLFLLLSALWGASFSPMWGPFFATFSPYGGLFSCVGPF